MNFPELKIVDKVANKDKNHGPKELLVVQLDWSEFDKKKIVQFRHIVHHLFRREFVCVSSRNFMG